MKRLKNFSVHPIRGHKIRNQITRSAVYPGHNYHGKYVQRIYDLSPTFHPPSTPARLQRTATKSVGVIFHFRYIKSVLDRRHRGFPWNTGRAVDFVGRIVSRKEGCHRVARDVGAPAA